MKVVCRQAVKHLFANNPSLGIWNSFQASLATLSLFGVPGFTL